MHPGGQRLLEETVLWIRLVIHTLLYDGSSKAKDPFKHARVCVRIVRLH
uniref:Uncharacterized protein n=1 Tax=Nelumbo nucifera TaxID=4432 RepID=A0A822XYC9_NELNU|nr:TPA_asm: hypothetical protein HUJ06_025582 [Nelumbo nucifera]